jgi:hypothetical protein
MRSLGFSALLTGCLLLALPTMVSSQEGFNYTCPPVGMMGCFGGTINCFDEMMDPGNCTLSNGEQQPYYSFKTASQTYYNCITFSGGNCTYPYYSKVCTTWFFFNHDCDFSNEVCPALFIYQASCSPVM